MRSLLSMLLLSLFFSNVADGKLLSTSTKQHLAKTVVQASLVAGLVFGQQPLVAGEFSVVDEQGRVGALVSNGPTFAGGFFAEGDLRELNLRMQVLAMREGIDGLVFAEFVGRREPIIGNKISPLIFGRLSAWTHDRDFRDDYEQRERWQYLRQQEVANRVFAQGIVGAGLDFANGLLSTGKFVRIQLRAGAGMIGHYEKLFYPEIEENDYVFQPRLPASRATRELVRLDNSQVLTSYYQEPETDDHGDFVAMFELTFEIDKVTVGDLIGSERGSGWHLLPVLPHSEITTAVYQPVLDSDNRIDDGIPVYMVNGKIQLAGNFYLDFEHLDSPHFYRPHRRVGIRFDYIVPPDY